jgi:hypothetical protein
VGLQLCILDNIIGTAIFMCMVNIFLKYKKLSGSVAGLKDEGCA